MLPQDKEYQPRTAFVFLGLFTSLLPAVKTAHSSLLDRLILQGFAMRCVLTFFLLRARTSNPS